MRKEKICIGIPCFAGVTPEVLEDYMRFAYHLGRRYQDYDFFLRIKSKSEQFRARNAIVESAITVGCDWLLMIDDDHIFDIENHPGDPKDGTPAYEFLRKLIAHNVDIVGPLYFQRGGSGKPVVMDENEFGEPYFISDLDLGNSLEERAVQGGGCMLIKMHIFNKIQTPWFEPEFQWGTDVQLCKNARAAGFKVYNDSSIEIGHQMNERIVLTSENKGRYAHDSSVPLASPIEIEWRTDSILHKYKYDAVEYLEISEKDIETEFNSLKENYAMRCLELEARYGLGTIEYYANMGPEQLCRQVLFHYSPNAKASLASILHEIKPQRMIGLDFGCGSAPVGCELAKRGGKIHFIDVDGACSYEFLKWRCKKYGFDHVSFDWPEPGTANYALALDSIEHLHNWKEILGKIVDSLRPHGNFLTNFMRIKDIDNIEHIFMDKPVFMKWMVENGMKISTDCVFVKGE